GIVLEQTDSLRPPFAWQAVTQTIAAQQNQFSLSLNADAAQRFFRLRALTQILSTSPANGESGVSVTRETVVHFTQALAATVAFDSSRLYAEFGGRHLLSRSELSSDRTKVTLFYLEPLPGNARVRVTINGDGLTDSGGEPLDLDGDGLAGGRATLAFDTATLA